MKKFTKIVLIFLFLYCTHTYYIQNLEIDIKANIFLQTVSSTAQCAAGATVSTSLHSLLPGQQNVSQSPFLDQTNNKSSWSAIMSRSGDGA